MFGFIAALSRPMDTPALVGLVVGRSRTSNDRVRLSHDCLGFDFSQARIDEVCPTANSAPSRPHFTTRGRRTAGR